MAFLLPISSQLITAAGTPSNSGLELKKGVKFLVESMPKMRILPPEYVLPMPISPLLAREELVPVIDLSGLDGPPEHRIFTINEISSACADWGFFRISNHGVKISLMNNMLESVDHFFNLTLEEKMIYASDDVMDPVRYGTSLNTTKAHNLHWRDYLRHFGHPIESTFHLWPNSPPNYRYIAKEFLEEVRRLAIRLAGAISEGLGLDDGYIARAFGKGTQIIASNYYPPCPEPHRTLGLAAHSDHGGLTILMQNDVDGLQIKRNGDWIAVGHVPGTFVVNLGDFLEILSNGRYKSVEHRGVVNARKKRISVAVGHGPDMIAIVEPAGPLVDKKSAVKYRSITYKDYMRIQQTSAIRGKSPLQAITINSSPEEALLTQLSQV